MNDNHPERHLEAVTDPADGSERTIRCDYRFAPVPEELVFDSSVSAHAIRVYAVLMRHGMDPTRCYPSQTRMAELAGDVSYKTIQRAVTELVEAGWVERLTRVVDGRQVSNGYQLFTTRHGTPVSRGMDTGDQGGMDTRVQGGWTPVSREREQEKESNKNERSSTPNHASMVRVWEADFEVWWDGVWRKVAKGAARRAYLKARQAGTTADELVGARDRFREHLADQGTERRFQPHPSTWLNAERHLDDDQSQNAEVILLCGNFECRTRLAADGKIGQCPISVDGDCEYVREDL